MHNLYFARLQFDIKLSSSFKSPNYAGSMLRGAFGHALKKIACVSKMESCKNCPLKSDCAYPIIFSPEHLPQPTNIKVANTSTPYVIEPLSIYNQPLKPGDLFSFNMVLLKPAIDNINFIIMAWKLALQTGLSKQEAKGLLVDIKLEQNDSSFTSIYDSTNNVVDLKTLLNHEPTKQTFPQKINSIEIQLISHLRIQIKNKPISSHQFSADSFLINLIRRIELLKDYYSTDNIKPDFKALKEQSENIKISKHLYWKDWERYSNRQKQSMKLGGLRGYFTLTGDLDPFIEYLYLGQWLHVGKNAVFGLGQYKINQIKSI